MPRQSRRATLIDAHAALLRRRLVWLYARLVLDEHDDIEDTLDLDLLRRVQLILLARYSCSRIQLQHKTRFGWFLRDCSDREFLRSFRMERASFYRLAALLDGANEFVVVNGKKRMARQRSNFWCS